MGYPVINIRAHKDPLLTLINDHDLLWLSVTYLYLHFTSENSLDLPNSDAFENQTSI